MSIFKACFYKDAVFNTCIIYTVITFVTNKETCTIK